MTEGKGKRLGCVAIQHSQPRARRWACRALGEGLGARLGPRGAQAGAGHGRWSAQAGAQAVGAPGRQASRARYRQDRGARQAGARAAGER